MITSFDDYPIHQSHLPIAHTASGDPNHYDRYFYNGYSRDGSVFFAAAMGLYPNRGVMDASFSVIHNGEQVNIHASARAHPDRIRCTEVGPVRVEVVEPMKRHRLTVDSPEHSLRCELEFEASSLPFEEPVFEQRAGLKLSMQYTRLTQLGTWTGWIEVDGDRIEVDAQTVVGSRDRSWGIRNVGERVQLGAPLNASPQFYWLWAPVCFDGFGTMFDINEYGDGERWHHSGAVLDGTESVKQAWSVEYDVEWLPGTRHMRSFQLRYGFKDEHITLDFEPIMHFQMFGLGYMHPEWTHGGWKGELVVGGDRFTLPVENPMAPHHVHVQTLSSVTCNRNGNVSTGTGILETLVMGPHAPSGLTELFDPAK
ncbi:MAG: hypothetical protein EBS32_00110 [Actinobacteria bacterium]|nr:hypothetical protein [Actinomycetota bacterium]